MFFSTRNKTRNRTLWHWLSEEEKDLKGPRTSIGIFAHYAYVCSVQTFEAVGLKKQSKVLLRTESPAGAVLERPGFAGALELQIQGVLQNPARIQQFVQD